MDVAHSHHLRKNLGRWLLLLSSSFQPLLFDHCFSWYPSGADTIFFPLLFFWNHFSNIPIDSTWDFRQEISSWNSCSSVS